MPGSDTGPVLLSAGSGGWLGAEAAFGAMAAAPLIVRRRWPVSVVLAVAAVYVAAALADVAFTNVTTYASGARALVQIHHGVGELTVTVADDGSPNPAGPAASGGLGLSGMRERASLLGGTLTAGQGPDGGFVVTARLPVRNGAQGPPGAQESDELSGQKSAEGLK
jgi:nitrate/nitrite-specific signal transduction histidine kinase